MNINEALGPSRPCRFYWMALTSDFSAFCHHSPPPFPLPKRDQNSNGDNDPIHP